MNMCSGYTDVISNAVSITHHLGNWYRLASLRMPHASQRLPGTATAPSLNLLAEGF